MRYRPGGMEHAARLPFIDLESDYPCCWYCPALRLPREGFLVADRPSRSWPFDAADGFRYTTDGRIPVCVHPGRVGLQPERTAPPPATAPAPESCPDPAQTPAGPRRWWWRNRTRP